MRFMRDKTSDTRFSHEKLNDPRLGGRMSQGVRFFCSLLHLSIVSPVALLVDGENMSADVIATVLAEAGRFGSVTIRRVYGNWGSPSMQAWKNVTSHYALQQAHTLQTISGKNAADIALVVDAMDLLYRDHIERFCLVTSDSDYTALVLRLRMAGCIVVGIGRPTTPPALQEACTVFLSTDQLGSSASRSKPMGASSINAARGYSSTPADTPVKLNAELTALLTDAYQEAIQGKVTGWILISRLGVGLKKHDPTFTPKSYGYKDLSTLVTARTDLFEARKQDTKGGQLEVRRRQ
jgi:hypothetical protein